MLQTFSQQAEELWRFLEQEIFSQPFTAATALHWLEEQLHKGMSFNALSFLLLFPGIWKQQHNNDDPHQAGDPYNNIHHHIITL